MIWGVIARMESKVNQVFGLSDWKYGELPVGRASLRGRPWRLFFFFLTSVEIWNRHVGIVVCNSERGNSS